MTRSFIRAAVDHFTTLEDMLREVNRNLYRDTDDERFVTLGCCLLDKKHGLIEYARAGHTELIYFIRNHIRRLYPDGTGVGDDTELVSLVLFLGVRLRLPDARYGVFERRVYLRHLTARVTHSAHH